MAPIYASRPSSQERKRQLPPIEANDPASAGAYLVDQQTVPAAATSGAWATSTTAEMADPDEFSGSAEANGETLVVDSQVNSVGGQPIDSQPPLQAYATPVSETSIEISWSTEGDWDAFVIDMSGGGESGP